MAVIFEGEVCTGLSGPIAVARWDEKKEVSQLAGVGLFVVEGGFATQGSGKEEGIINESTDAHVGRRQAGPALPVEQRASQPSQQPSLTMGHWATSLQSPEI